MSDTQKTVLTKVFKYVCLVCAILLIFQCIRQYSLNKDVAEIKFKEFQETSDDIYPSITFCNRSPFVQENLAKYDKKLTIDAYKKFLAGHCSYINGTLRCGGQEWRRNWIDINYDEVTYHIKDFLSRFLVYFLNNDLLRSDMISYIMENESLVPNHGPNAKKYENLTNINYYVSARHFLYKCFTFDVPFVPGKFIHNFQLDINASIFADGVIKPATNVGEYFVTFGYPNQFIRSSVRNKVIIKNPNFSTKCYWQETLIGSMEVLARRDKSDHRCNEDWRNHDYRAMTDISKKVGCTPSHWRISSDLNRCWTHKQYRAITKEFNSFKISIPPCKSIERLSQTTYETDLGNKCSFFYPYYGKLMLTIDFHKETMYKEIELVRSYTIQNLIGNAGKRTIINQL